MRLSGNEVLAVTSQSYPLTVNRFLDTERARADCQPGLPGIGRYDRRLIHRQKGKEKRERLLQRDVESVAIVDRDAAQLVAAMLQNVRRTADVAQNPIARRAGQQPDEAVVDIPGLDFAPVVKTRAPTEMEAIHHSVLQDLPSLGQPGHQLRPFAIRDQRGVHGAGHEAEGRSGHVNRIEGELLPKHS